MSIYLILLIILLILIIIFLTYKIISINLSLKEIENKLNIILNSDTNNLISTSTNNKIVNNIANKLNIHLKEIRKQELEFKNGNKEIKRSITDISHDIRTPLTAISGYIDLLNKEKLTKKQKEYLKIIDKSSNNLISLTEELFDYSRSFDLNDNNNKEKLCINNVLEDVILSYYALFKEKNISPDINLCQEKIYLEMNRSMLTRVFENIISNAIKYSDDNIKICLFKTGKIIFSNKTKKLDRVSVERIFDRYYTIETANKKSGIGLSIAKQIIESNKGKIKASYQNNELLIEINFNINN